MAATLTAAHDVNTPWRGSVNGSRRNFRTITASHLGVDCADSVIAAVEMPAAALDVRTLTRVTEQVLSQRASLGEVCRQLAPKRRIHDSG
jgi:hypothetical protein